MRKKVELVTFAASWEWQGKTNHNFVIKFTDAVDTPEKLDRYAYVSSENPQTKFIVGQEIDFDMSKDKDGKQKTIKVTLGGKSYEFDKIEPTKQSFSGGGGGGQKRYPKTYNEYLNELAWQTQQHTINFFCHRTTLDPLTKFQEYYDVFYKSAFEKLKKE